jgi:hypothetical protein
MKINKGIQNKQTIIKNVTGTGSCIGQTGIHIGKSGEMISKTLEDMQY